MDEIHAQGFWLDNSSDHHRFDPELCNQLTKFFLEQNAEVIDVGCGLGQYIECFRKVGLHCEGYDGNPHTPYLTNNLCQIMDFSRPIKLKKRYDWVLSLEVGEHIPSIYEDFFLDNLSKLSTKGLVLSCAVIGQPGRGHVNCRNNTYIKEKMKHRGFLSNPQVEKSMRCSAHLSYFKKTLMVFNRA